jgi:hypothetical protein
MCVQVHPGSENYPARGGNTEANFMRFGPI